MLIVKEEDANRLYGVDNLKKIIIGILLIITSLFSISSSATSDSEYLISDTTTIEEDFKSLGLSINDYIDSKYDFEKWYVIAMSESYIDTKDYNIQTYFYMYNPKRYGETDYMSTVASFDLTFNLNGAEILSKTNGSKLDYNVEHCIYKVKGFSYKYSSSAEVSITEIKHYNLRGSGITSDSNFKATMNHSKLNGFLVELNFNSTIIIDDINVVRVIVDQDDNFINDWISFWSNERVSLFIYFYNFNFPEHIEYDSVEYAKFQYNYLKYNQKYYFNDENPDNPTLINKEHVIKDYNNDSKTLRVNDVSQEMTFPTFYLGNRMKDGQFNFKDKIIKSGDVSKFDVDCSVLLDSTHKIDSYMYNYDLWGNRTISGEEYSYTILDDIELLELHYKHDGILYKCQVVSKPVDKDDVEDVVTGDQSMWDRIKVILINISNQILKFFGVNSESVPEFVKILIVVLLLIIVLSIMIPILIPMMIKLLLFIIFLPFKVIWKILNKK